MAVDLSSIMTGAEDQPARIVLQGVQGIGKSTLAAAAPLPIFIQTEDGLGMLDVPHFPLAETYQDVIDAMSSLATQDHDYQTLVVDSLDWLEPLIHRHVCAQNNWATIDEAGYGKGYTAAGEIWSEFIDALNYIRATKKMTVILTAHVQIKRHDNPATDPYDRYTIKLHKNAGNKMVEYADCVLFANYRISTTQTEGGFNQKKTRAVGSGERILFTEERPSHIAKNRFNMPPELPLDWDTLASHIPYLSAPTPTKTKLKEIA